MDKVTLHTLGPTNTNCEAAAKYYLDKNNLDGEIILYETLESAVDIVANDKDALLLTCIVYPKLNKLVFDNLEKLKLVDCFIFNTFEMVLSTKKEVELSAISTIISHPAPTPLINKFGKEFLWQIVTAKLQNGVSMKNLMLALQQFPLLNFII